MAATPSKLNTILNAIVTLLQTIDNVAAPNTWLTKPLTVRRELKAKSLTIEARPVVAVELQSYHEEQRGAGRHEGKATVAVYIITSGDHLNAEATVINVARDVQMAIESAEVLPGATGVEVINVGETFDYQTETEIATASGLAIATLTFPVRYRFDHTAQ